MAINNVGTLNLSIQISFAALLLVFFSVFILFSRILTSVFHAKCIETPFLYVHCKKKKNCELQDGCMSIVHMVINLSTTDIFIKLYYPRFFFFHLLLFNSKIPLVLLLILDKNNSVSFKCWMNSSTWFKVWPIGPTMM
jgi:hypothetical protein